jgi:hypothetical protein
VQQIHFCFAIYSRHRSNEYFSNQPRHTIGSLSCLTCNSSAIV